MGYAQKRCRTPSLGYQFFTETQYLSTTRKKSIMKKNMGNIDRGVRVGIAVVIGILFATNVISGVLAYILLGLSAVFVFTSVVSFCPIYTLLGINTCPAKKA
jgi:uncharacterized membrane protein